MARTPLVAPGPPLTSDELVRYSRQLRMPQLGLEGQRRLKAARVLVLGAGGLGSPVLLYLAAAGVGTIGVVDDDTVDVSNLQRQTLHTVRAVGSLKARSAAEAIRGLNPLVSVVLHEVRLDAANAPDLFAGYDLVVDATDNFATRYVANDAAAALGLPYVWGAVLRFDGQVSTFWGGPRGAAALAAGAGTDAADVGAAGGAGVTLRDLFPVPPVDDAGETCAVAGVLGPLCGSVGSAMATEAIKLVVGFGELLLGRVLVLDAFDGSYTVLPFAFRPPSAGDAAVAPAGEVASAAEAAAAPARAGERKGASMSVRELADRLAERAAGRDQFVLLDVREPWEFEAVSIEGAVLVPLGEVISEEVRRAIPAESTVLVHCHHDTRSRMARDALLQSGYRDVTFIEGGIDAWSREIDPTMPRY